MDQEKQPEKDTKQKANEIVKETTNEKPKTSIKISQPAKIVIWIGVIVVLVAGSFWVTAKINDIRAENLVKKIEKQKEEERAEAKRKEQERIRKEKEEREKRPKVTIPDLNGMSEDQIAAWFTENNIKGNIVREYSDTVPKNGVIKQSVEPGDYLHQEDKMTVYISNGKAPTTSELNALKKAQEYSKYMYMSKQKIYKQLTSEYGERFTPEQAQYAIDNLNVNWNENALMKAKDYQSNLNMSKDRIYQQLTSQYGEGFTPEQARYAVDNLPE